MNVPFLDLKKQFKPIKNEINKAIKRVLDRQFFILGPELINFELLFSKYLSSKYVVGVNSGTDGLILALQSIGISKGDEVITVPNSFIATTLAITQLGAKPIFVDIDPDTYQINANKIEMAITSKTKAILPVHLYGAPCQIDEIMRIAKKHHLYVIEDACQSHGATFNNKQVGTFGDIGVFSFYPGKNLGAYGDAGAICTNNKDLYERIKKLRNYGQKEKYYHSEIGINTRLDEIQAAVLSVKLKYLNQWNLQRNKIARLYIKGLSNVKTQKIYDYSKSCYHIFTIEVSNRDYIKRKLAEKGIQTLIHYPLPIHLQECYKYLGYKKDDFPYTESAANKILSIPIYPELSKEEILYIIANINKLTV